MSGESAPVSKSRTDEEGGGRLRQAEVDGVAIWRVMRQGRGSATTATGRHTRRKPGSEPASETGGRRTAGGRIT